MISILIVEDDADIAEVLELQLRQSQYRTHIIADGSDVLPYLQHTIPQLIVLDVMLPGTMGTDICKCIRRTPSLASIPILMLTARTRPEHIIEGLDAGADDYVTKPFDMNVLLARVRSLLRRQEHSSSPLLLDHAGLQINTESGETTLHGSPLSLTLTEARILIALIRQRGRVLTRTKLMENVQGENVHVTERTIDTHMVSLRKKVGELATDIETVRGIGYRMSAHAKS